eukprot:TRINITY_DN9150_c0_g1_i3.p1 TRINITY_DN9150_c0_g1~~TRINITY_DN9150_c0_g1_i3.p1  ORF type:complete len:408 (-),score=96.45 TRINITY_DN9150_c0_g1_i3:147-1370(-)
MDKEEIKKIIHDVADNIVQASHQEGRLRTRSQAAASPKDGAEPKSDQSKGVRRAIRKFKSAQSSAARKKLAKTQEEQKEEPPSESEEQAVAEPPLSKTTEVVQSSEDPLKNSIPQAVGVFLYKPLTPLPSLAPYIQRVIEIRIAKEYMCKSNKAYRMRNFWGSDIYTSDSDIVCILQHSGMFIIGDLPPDKIAGVAVYFRVSKGRNSYQGSLRSGIRSKKLGIFDGCSIKPENCRVLETLGTTEELIQMAGVMSETIPTSFKKSSPINMRHVIAPPETEVIFNLSSEPAYKFSLPAFADYSSDPAQRTSNILYENVFYFETADRRYELAKEDNKSTSYRLSEVLSPFEKDSKFMESHAIPLDKQFVKPLLSGVGWKEFRWSENRTLHVKEMVIEDISNFKCFPLKKA